MTAAVLMSSKQSLSDHLSTDSNQQVPCLPRRRFFRVGMDSGRNKRQRRDVVSGHAAQGIDRVLEAIIDSTYIVSS